MRDLDDAVEADHAALVWRVHSLPGGSSMRDSHGQHVWTGLASGFFNNTILARWGGDSDAAVSAIVDEARLRGAPWRFYVSAASTPTSLTRRLADSGLSLGAPGRSMVLDEPLREPRAVAGLEIEPVEDAAGLERWLRVRVVSEGWGLDTADAWRTGQGHLGLAVDSSVPSWVGRIGIEDVAITCLQHEVGSEVAGIYHVVTVPSARRRGIASAMTAHAVSVARSRGASRIVLSASRMAERAYERLGFVGAGEFTYWYDEGLGA